MVNRFDQYTPMRSTFVPQEFTPNFEAMGAILQQNQQEYNSLLEAYDKVPNFTPTVKEKKLVMDYKKSNEEKLQKITNAYTQGVGKGKSEAQRYLRELKKDWTPGGKPYEIEQNYNAYVAYNEQLDRLYEKGQIKEDTYRASKQKSLNDFQSSYKEDGMFNAFSGYNPAQDIDLISELKEIMKDYKPTTISGRKVGVAFDGSYYYADTEEQVPPEVLAQDAMRILNIDPKFRNYLQQREDLFGENQDFVKLNAAQTMVNMFGGKKQTRDYYKHWVNEANYKDRLDRKREKDKELDVLSFSTQVLENPFTKNKTINWESQVARKKVQTKPGYNLGAKTGSTTTYESPIKFEQEQLTYLKSETFLKEHPGFEQIFKSLPPLEKQVPVGVGTPVNEQELRERSGSIMMIPETELEKYKRAAKEYNQLVESAKNYTFQFDIPKDNKVQENNKKLWIGENGMGAWRTSNIYLLDPSGRQIGEEMTAENFLSTTDIKAEDLYDNAMIGEVTNGAGVVSEGAMTMMVLKGDKYYTAVLTNDKTPKIIHNKELLRAQEGLTNFSVNATDPNQPIQLQDVVNGNRMTGYYQIRYENQRTPEGPKRIAYGVPIKTKKVVSEDGQEGYIFKKNAAGDFEYDDEVKVPFENLSRRHRNAYSISNN